MLLGHAFEMLLKAVVYQARGRIRDPGELHSYGFARTINITFSDLSAIDEEDLTVLRAIKQDRDAATHDTVAMSDELLWLHVRSAVTVFGPILEQHFGATLEDIIPARVVPVAAPLVQSRPGRVGGRNSSSEWPPWLLLSVVARPPSLGPTIRLATGISQ